MLMSLLESEVRKVLLPTALETTSSSRNVNLATIVSHFCGKTADANVDDGDGGQTDGQR